jgi:putative inorganic carbon (hco3(-)) transporter
MGLTGLVFVLLFLAGLVLALIRHPIFGLFSYMLAFYMGPDTAWWGEGLPDLRWALSSAFVTLIAVFVYKQADARPAWYSHRSVKIMMALAAWMWIQTPWALSTDSNIFVATLFTKYVLIFAIIYLSLDTADRVHHFAMAHIVGCFWWGYLAWQNPGGGRLEDIGTGDVSGSAFASMHVSTGLAIAGFFVLSFPGWKRWAPFLAIPFILNSIILMQTRGAFVGLVAAAPMALLLAPQNKRKIVTIYLVLGGILLLIVANEDFWERMGTIKPEEGEQMETSAASRLDIAAANWRMFKDYPLGAGHRGNDLLSPEYMPATLLTDKDGSAIRSAHNTVMAILVDHGFVGIILFALLHITILRAVLRLRRASLSDPTPQTLAFAAGLGTALVIYWFNAQFANMIKAEIVIWIAAMAAALESHRVTKESALSKAPAGRRGVLRRRPRSVIGAPAPEPVQRGDDSAATPVKNRRARRPSRP